MPLTHFHPVIAKWFHQKFKTPTEVQVASWPAIMSGSNTLIAAPTGAGKTLAAFLSCIDTLLKMALRHELKDQIHVVYVSPLKALSNDVQKNLQQPLAEISEIALAAGCLLPELRVEVRTGDTPAKNRRQMLQRPPHILVTTPESLFLLVTAQKSRDILRDVRTVIVDEIHAVAANKRGAHLALSLERLDALTHTTPIRIGLSATQKPLEEIARFLVGRDPQQEIERPGEPWREGPCSIINIGPKREMDLAVETPKDELGAVATNAIWADIYDRLTELVQEHRSTLVFVNTRRLAERVAHHLTDRLGAENVATHHGSLSRRIRLSAEERLKKGQTRVVVATASLELGIDIGFVDLVCQIGSPRAIATGFQRIGRAGHWVGAIPKGRLFCTTRDELVECAALIRAIRQGNLDRVTVPPHPLDILAQQIVAAVATQEWREDDLYALCTRAYPYRDLTRQQFDAVVRMVAEGFSPGRGRQLAYVFHDRSRHCLRPRRGARLAALTSGGAIPDTATYTVVAEPQGTTVGSVDEDFAVESLAGDIILLGNTSWRIRGVETGIMRVEDAHGAPPTIPFWRGEAPSRTIELSEEVALLRSEVSQRMTQENPAPTANQPAQTRSGPSPALEWLQTECGLDQRGAEQALAYITAGHRALGAVPTQDTIIAERFFDEAGGLQLVIHSPFGGRVNRAWGLALRKRFCVNFDFELQAAATDEGLVLSLGEQHSFPLETIFHMLHPNTVREVLVQALLAAPMFTVRWRWNANRSLALLRFRNGRRVPLHIQRMRAEDLLVFVFPMATACQENHVGPIPVPDHPLVQETIRDCLEEAMDLNGLITLLTRMEEGVIRCLSVESPAPSPFSHEILNANPYAFLDDAPLEERRARAVNMRQVLPPEEAGKVGALDSTVIASVCEEAWPLVRSSDELQEVLESLVWVPEAEASTWSQFLPPLIERGQALVVTVPAEGALLRGWTAPEHLPALHAIFPTLAIHSGRSPTKENDWQSSPGDPQEAALPIVRGWMECLGPITAEEVANKLYLPPSAIHTALLQLEAKGEVLRGQFRPLTTSTTPLRGGEKVKGHSTHQEEWCNRRLLARIHRRTVTTLRREIEPVSATDFMRFLFRWQHVAPTARLHGEAGLFEILKQLAGFEAAASAWEPQILSRRVATYSPDTLDYLCLRGTVTWGRLIPPLQQESLLGAKRKQRITPTSLAPICVFPREDAEWLLELARKGGRASQALLPENLSGIAQKLYRFLQDRGASFFIDLVRGTGQLQAEVEQGLWELASSGLASADGFDNLRALLDPKRRRGIGRERTKRPRHSIGRWSLLVEAPFGHQPEAESHQPTESWARQLLHRYGIVFRDLVKRETLPTAWRDLLMIYRRMELRGEIRGGRFVAGFTGEQFGLPEAVEALRAVRRDPHAGAQEIRLSGSDPLNLVGIILPGERVPAFPSNSILFQNGQPVREEPHAIASA